MSQCGVNISVDSIVEAIISNYGEAIASEITKLLNLGQYVSVNSGVAHSLTLKDSLTVDDGVKASLCSILQDCIQAKIDEELGCERDNHVTKFYIDKTKDHLVVELKFGERLYISRAEIESWVRVTGSGGGGIESGELILAEEHPTQIIRVTNRDGTEVDIDVSFLKDLSIVGGTVEDGRYIKLERSDGRYINIDASTLISNSPFIVSGVFTERDGGYWLDFTRSDNSKVNVDMTDTINKLLQLLFGRIMNTGYRINTQGNHYTTQESDFDGRTIIRANRNADQTITITKPPSEDFIGKAIIVRKTNGEAGTLVNLNSGDGVSILPEDSTPIRRSGSSVTLVYIGDGVYDAFGELP